MPQCAVATCRNSHRKTKGRRVRYHRFPAEESVRERWVAVCGRSTVFNTTTARVCSLHFSAPSYERDVEHELLGLPPRSRLRRGAVPDLYVPVVVPSLIKKLNSAPPLSRGGALNGHGKNYVAKGGKPKGPGVANGRRVPLRAPLMTPPSPHQSLPSNQCDVLLALGLVPRNNNSWCSPLLNGHVASAGGRMPVMESAARLTKPRSRASSLDAVPRGPLQENGATSRGPEADEAVSEGEGVARAAAALVSVKVDVDEGASPLVFRGDGVAAVKQEPVEPATSSGCGSEEEDEVRARQGNKRTRVDGSSEGAEKRARLAHDDEPMDEEDDRERMVRTFVDAASGEGPEEAARCADSLRNELNMLRALAEAKEREWNQVIRLRALKEEMLLRLERRRAVLSLSNRGSARPRPILPKPLLNGAPNSVIGEGRQGPILDVRSIIADYRSRHPEAVPRRGRRLKPGGSPAPSELSELGSLLSEALHRPTTDNSRPSSADSTRSGVPQAEPSISFKDVLVKFAKMSQSEQQQQQSRLPYPEVTLHPVPPAPSLGPASSLLQGILSKPGQASSQAPSQQQSIPRATNFSPTLARLLTAPERPTHQGSGSTPPVSIADLLGPTKQGRTEITITPVASQASKPTRANNTDVAVVEGREEEDEEGGETGDRLVIDEAANDAPPARDTREASSDARARRRGNDQESDEEDEEVPECQGCHRHQAQFVCAGCGNQWYCSRECQVAAWDEHSEVCSG